MLITNTYSHLKVLLSADAFFTSYYYESFSVSPKSSQITIFHG